MGSKSKEKSSGKERSKSKPTKTAPPVEKIDATLASLFETSVGTICYWHSATALTLFAVGCSEGSAEADSARR